MIGHIRGTLLDKSSHEVLVEAAGVGYEISLTMPAWFELGDSGSEVAIWTHLVVREDVQQLYGFRDRDERALFRELIRVSGIGPKVAQGILSGMDTGRLIAAIRDENIAALVKMPGVGKKTAERLVIELQDRLAGMGGGSLNAAESMLESKGNSLLDEAEQALLALGYRPADCKKMLANLSDSLDTVEAIVRHALRSAHRS